MPRWVGLLAMPLAEASYCCFAPTTQDRCGVCTNAAESDNYCAGSEIRCETDCNHVWCDGDPPESDDVPTEEVPPTLDDDDLDWVYGTWTTGYWDCCKPSCSFPGKGSTTGPTRFCDFETGEDVSDANELSICVGGRGAACADQVPFTVQEKLSMSFAAAAVDGISGLTGDENCGQCFHLQWVDDEFSWGGGAAPEIVGWNHLIQVTNIGFDVSGDHSFDLQIPGAGQGLFNTACSSQFPGFTDGDFDCDNNYGGCNDVSGCARLPEALRAGCEWRYSPAYRWLEANGKSNNPITRFRRIKCPDDLVALSETRPLDDDNFPEFVLDHFLPTPRPTSITKEPTLKPSSLSPTLKPSSQSPTLKPTQSPTPGPSPGPSSPKPSPPRPTATTSDGGTPTDARPTTGPSVSPTTGLASEKGQGTTTTTGTVTRTKKQTNTAALASTAVISFLAGAILTASCFCAVQFFQRGPASRTLFKETYLNPQRDDDFASSIECTS